MIQRIRWWLRGLGIRIPLNAAEAREMHALARQVLAKMPMTMYGRSGIGSVPMPKEVSDARGTDGVRQVP